MGGRRGGGDSAGARAVHEPVLLVEAIRYLRAGAGLYLDATLGDGGHAEALLAAEPAARLLGCDRDPAALAFAGRRLERFGARMSLAHARFRDLPDVHLAHGSEPLAGALLDLGLSSRQIDDPERGLSFMREGPLDLRLDPSAGEPAHVRIARADEAKLTSILRTLGDVPGAVRIARALVAAARAGRLETTREAVEAVRRASPRSTHPRRLAQVFQALRMWVNEEADDLDAALAWLPSAMRPGGIVVTLAYHSGEDRKIKRALRGPAEPMSPRRTPPGLEARLPVGPWDELTRRVVTPSDEEVSANPRARSARLRAFRRKP